MESISELVVVFPLVPVTATSFRAVGGTAKKIGGGNGQCFARFADLNPGGLGGPIGRLRICAQDHGGAARGGILGEKIAVRRNSLNRNEQRTRAALCASRMSLARFSELPLRQVAANGQLPLPECRGRGSSARVFLPATVCPRSSSSTCFAFFSASSVALNPVVIVCLNPFLSCCLAGFGRGGSAKFHDDFRAATHLRARQPAFVEKQGCCQPGPGRGPGANTIRSLRAWSCR